VRFTNCVSTELISGNLAKVDMRSELGAPSLRIIRRSVALAVLVLFLVSVNLPTVLYADQRQWSNGFHLLLIGWLGPIEGQFGWYANLAMGWTLIILLLGRPPPLIVCVVGAALAVSTRFTLHEITTDVSEPIQAFGPGFYLWIGCSVALLINAVVETAIAGFSRNQLSRE
jgi:hypothetical protein